MVLNNYINFIKLDEQKRIIVSINVIYQNYLHNDKNRQLIKNYLQELLKSDFIKLEIGKNRLRITVKASTEEKNLNIIKTELVKGLEMVMRIMGL